MNIAELEAYIAAIELEIAEASCGPCTRKKKRNLIANAKRQIIAVRRENRLAASAGENDKA